MTVAIHYTLIKAGQGAEVSGLRVAVEGWLKAWFRYGAPEHFPFLIGEDAEWSRIQEIAAGAGLDGRRLVRLDRQNPRAALAPLTTVVRLNPDPQRLLWQRALLPGAGFAFCGLAHAICGIEGGTLLEQYCLGPSDSTDAIVCPSGAVRAAIAAFWESYRDYLRQRFGVDYECPVQLPIIPLGIDTAHFETIAAPSKRRQQREALGLAEDDIVVLWIGRLSFATKVHPLAMFQAVDQAAEATEAKVRFVMMGQFMPADAEDYFHKMAADFCPHAKVTFVSSDDPRFPDGIWASGDIFLSLVDNMQESFGLTPLEAMAAGLPRVVSDWDGYRESVIDGEDGFLVRTRQPPPGSGRELAENLLSGRDTYGSFLAKTALMVAVDVEMAAAALALLIRDENKRKAVAAKARAKVTQRYDWRQVIPAYEGLWAELAARRQRETGKLHSKAWRSALPQAPDPFTMYASHPSGPLKETDKLTVTATPEQIATLWRHELNVLAADVMVPDDRLMKLIKHISSHGGLSIGDLLQDVAAANQPQQWRTLAWLLKLGIVRAD